ncbi:MAG TPA: DUF5343 domain-containing protein [Solirubrobacteraceae bacterium]
MANYPYISGQTAVIAAVGQLRKGFPAKVDAGYLQRFDIAPANESYVISILRFLGLIDEEGARVEASTAYFFGNDDSFKSGLEDTLRSAYSQLFDEMGDSALSAERGELTHWFRAADKTSDLVGQRQSSTFQTLAALAGHGELPSTRGRAAKKTAAATGGTEIKTKVNKKAVSKKNEAQPLSGVRAAASHKGETSMGQDVALTVRIEVNLPAGGDDHTYDAIFASIKKHLMS